MSWEKKERSHHHHGGGRGGGGGGPAPFLVKTHQMVEEEATNEVISWGEKGNSFVVWKPVEFARDLLPVHFKHNNFSSFVRQLNTYGFRKLVPDRWEFANDNFRRGEQSLLREIRRRKAFPSPSSNNKPTTIATPPKNATTANPTVATPSSASTSSTTSSPTPPPPPPPPPQQFLALSDENEKLKKDNQILNLELSNAKRQCQQLLRFLSNYVSMKDISANLLIKEATLAGVGNGDVDGEQRNEADKDDDEKEDDDDEEEGENEASLKLFGVMLKGTRKRGRCEEGSSRGRAGKACYGAGPWMGLNSPVRETNKVCN